MDVIDAILSWDVPSIVITVALTIFIVCQIVGETIEAFGKTVPVFFKVRKWFSDRKDAKQARINQYNDMANTLKEIKQQQQSIKTQQEKVETLLNEVNSHYDKDNISKRDKWMLEVNTTMNWAKERSKVYDSSVKELKELTEIVKTQTSAIDLNNKMTSDLYKQSARSDILNFSHRIINARRADRPLIVSREEFRKIRKTYEGYEEFLETYGGTNGEVDDAMEVIRQAERGEFDYIEFLEDIR